MIKQILLCTIFFFSLSFAMEQDTSQKAARQKELDELIELNPNPYKRTCGSYFLDGLYKLGNFVAGAQQFRTSTHSFDAARLEWLAENTSEQINGVRFVYGFIAICDTEMLVEAIHLLSKERPAFYFIYSYTPLDGANVFAAGTPPGTPTINLKTIAAKLKEQSQELKLNMYADHQGSFLTGLLPTQIDKDKQLKNSLKQWLSATE